MLNSISANPVVGKLSNEIFVMLLIKKSMKITVFSCRFKVLFFVKIGLESFAKALSTNLGRLSLDLNHFVIVV